MNTISTIRNVLGGALLAACLPALALPALAAGTTAAKNAHATQPMPAALRPVFYQALAKDAGAAYHINKQGCATLPKQTLKACFDSRGAHFTGATPLALRLEAYGRGNKLGAVQVVKPKIEGNQASYKHGTVTEWWRVLPVGFEQGFTIARRPAGHGELTLTLAMSRQDAGAPTIRRPGAGRDPVKRSIPTGGQDTHSHWIPASAGMTGEKNDNTLALGKLRYGQLVVTDAKGKVVPATLSNKDDRILITVNDAHAVYPLTVDPLVWLEQKVSASDGAPGDFFGEGVALDGSTAIIGSSEWGPFATSPGAAYVFTRSGGVWVQTQKLTASDGATGDAFGVSVALEGTTAFIGANCAPYDPDSGHCGPGAVYVFAQSGGTWTQTQKLTASDGHPRDWFGCCVIALDGATALIGASEATVNGNYAQGAAYVFSESGGVWTQTAKLTASDGAARDFFSSVALDGAIALVGATGADVNGNAAQGAVYAFTESGGVWTQAQKLTASDGVAGDVFGFRVALEGTTAVVGAPAEGTASPHPGAAYVFTDSGGTWTLAQKLTASDGEPGDSFGEGVALDGTTALVGAGQYPWGAGAAYLFEEFGGSWTQTQKLAASDGEPGDFFGFSVALDGTTTLVGAFAADIEGNEDQGAAYFYDRGDLGLSVNAPGSVAQGGQYVSQTIATNNASAATPAVTATIAVPAAASFVSATATQGTCSEDTGVVTCDFGPISADGGFATANVTLKATGAPGTTIHNSASIALATPPLTASAPTTITAACPEGYTEYDGTLAPGRGAFSPPYLAPAGEENAILIAPAGLHLYLLLHHAGSRDIYRVPGNEVHRWGPAGSYSWAVWAQGSGGDYTLCIKHP